MNRRRCQPPGAVEHRRLLQLVRQPLQPGQVDEHVEADPPPERDEHDGGERGDAAGLPVHGGQPDGAEQLVQHAGVLVEDEQADQRGRDAGDGHRQDQDRAEDAARGQRRVQQHRGARARAPSRAGWSSSVNSRVFTSERQNSGSATRRA